MAKKIIGGQVVEKKFSDLSWKLLGKNKQGWEKIDDFSNVSQEIKIKEFFVPEKKSDPVVPLAANDPEIVTILEEPKPIEPLEKAPEKKKKGRPKK